jgi:hypothetical protein
MRITVTDRFILGLVVAAVVVLGLLMLVLVGH